MLQGDLRADGREIYALVQRVGNAVSVPTPRFR